MRPPTDFEDLVAWCYSSPRAAAVEIERLRATVATRERACASYVEVLEARDAEIRRLKRTGDLE